MTAPAPGPRTSERALVRVVGTWGLVAAIVNLTVGAGIFRLPASVSAALGSTAALAYLLCALAMALIVLCFAEAGSRVALTGGLYAYVEVAFGPFIGFVMGVLLWAGITAAVAAVTSFFADSIAALVPALSSGRAMVILVVIAALSLLNVLGVRGANRFNAAMTIAKLAPLALLVIAGALTLRAGNLAWHGVPAASSITRASVALIFAFLGVESALVPSGEVRDAERTVPRAVLIAIGAVALLYIAIHLVTQGLLGDALAGQATPLAEAAGLALGPWGRTMILVGSSLSMFGYLSGMTLAAPRMLFAFARDGFLPRAVARVHPRWRTPYVAIAAQSALVVVLAISGRFEWLAIVATGGVLLVYGTCCLAAMELRRRDVRGARDPFLVPRIVPWLALLVIVALLATLHRDEWLAVLAAAGAAVVVYALTRGRRAIAAAAGTALPDDETLR